MKLIFKLIVGTMLTTSCSSEKHNDSNFNIPEMFKTTHNEKDINNLAFKYGDIIEFNVENQTIKSIIVDVKSDEMGKWIGLCFMKDGNLFGRKIPDGISGNCIELLDLTYLNEKGFVDCKITSNEKLNFNKIGIGADSPALHTKDVYRDYKRGIDERKKKESSCAEKFSNLYPINECYFSIQKIRQL